MKPVLTILFLFIFSTVFTQNCVEFRGFERTGNYHETGLQKKWLEGGPELFLKIEGIGKGYSQPILANEKIFVTGIKEDSTDILSAYNLKGKLLWDVAYGHSWIRSYIDSRSTPTYCDGKVYVSSGTGQLTCVDAATGKISWKVDAVKKFGGQIHRHGDAEAPLVVNNIVIYITGGEETTVVAFNKNNGNVVWKTKSMGGSKSYASPSVIKHNGRTIILAQTTNDLIAINPENGNIIWSYNLIQYHLKSQGIGAQTNIPLYKNGDLFVTSGYDHPGLMLHLADDGNSVELKWRNNTIDTHHGGVVLLNGVIYGSNWQNNANGNWVAVDWETGKTLWETKWENKGSVITADNMLYLYEEKRGNIALAEPSTDSLKISSTFKIKDGVGPHWAHPAIYNGKLFIRHGDVLMIYTINDNSILR